jgi:hypothetical protein
MKRLLNLTPYNGILPYASEIFGVYQPLLGWRSKRIAERVERGFAQDVAQVNRILQAKFDPRFKVEVESERGLPRIVELEPAVLKTSRTRSTGTFLTDAIARDLPPLERYDESIWEALVERDRVVELLAREVVPAIHKWSEDNPPAQRVRGASHAQAVARQVQRESVIAGYLLHLRRLKQFNLLKEIFYKRDADLQVMQAIVASQDPLEYIDPASEIDRVSLSPLGIVHLFRQYFFEFDTFLGSPVSHVWLSPGAQVELYEVTTRRTLVERSFESTLEMVLKTERTITDEDEISDAVKQDNKSDTKFGMNGSVEQGWIGGSATGSSSLDIQTTQSKAREITHRHMRQQTEKLSTEIRKNFKSTLRTVTETTDTSSKRYVLKNNEDAELVNYELRRKMRQVGVQVQDIGTYLCWQAYVDDPGQQLGIAKLVHVAKDPEIGTVPPPENIPMPENHTTTHDISIPFIPKTEDTLPEDDMDEVYRHGEEVNLDANDNDPEEIQWRFPGMTASCDKPGYEFESILLDPKGQDIVVEAEEVVEHQPGAITYGIRVPHVNFHDHAPLIVTAKITWRVQQSVRSEIDAKNRQKLEHHNELTKREFQKAFIEAARDRITQASKIETRPYADLREEERIVVYRALVQDMLTRGIPMPDDRTRHIVAELLNTIFDVDKMLYFVAPEWWRPRLHRSHQALGGIRRPPGSAAPVGGGSGGGVSPGPVGQGSAVTGVSLKDTVGPIYKAAKFGALNELSPEALKMASGADKEDKTIPSTDIVAWGGTGGARPDNYYITDESEPARMGSSLGWLLQLDGDRMRNAFLNAPWVKAVIPIRPGKERAALNWLQGVNVEGTDGLDDDYVAADDELEQIPHAGATVTIRDAIEHLCDIVAGKHEQAQQVGRFPVDEINDDNRVSATPIDKVFEHGFYPLEGGFRVKPEGESFEIFDQWVEVLPTDQIVPVAVTYDPKTGRQI